MVAAKTSVDNIEIYCSYDELADIDTLIPNPQNPNFHPKSQIELLARIIKEQGFRAVITVSNLSGYVVRGHGRLEACRMLGMKKVPVEYQDYKNLSLEKADLIADNRLSELSNVNEEMIADLLEEIQEEIPINLSGYEETDLELLLNKISKEDSNNIFDQEGSSQEKVVTYELTLDKDIAEEAIEKVKTILSPYNANIKKLEV